MYWPIVFMNLFYNLQVDLSSGKIVTVHMTIIHDVNEKNSYY